MVKILFVLGLVGFCWFFFFFFSCLLLLGMYFKLYYTFLQEYRRFWKQEDDLTHSGTTQMLWSAFLSREFSLRKKLNGLSRCNIILSLCNLEKEISGLWEYERFEASVAFVQSFSELIWKRGCVYRAWRRCNCSLSAPLRKSQILLDWPEIHLNREVELILCILCSYGTEFGSCLNVLLMPSASGSMLCRPVCCVIPQGMF